MSDIDETARLTRISVNHSYGEGFNGRLTKYRALKIMELVPGGGSLLDMGAGEGFLTRAIAGAFRKVVITEASPRYLESAKKNLSAFPVIFHNALIEAFKTAETFDVIIASGILEHVKEPQQVIQVAKHLLKPAGIFIAIVPNAVSLHRQVGLHMDLIQSCYDLGDQDVKVGHRRYYDLNQLKSEVEHAGLLVSGSGGILLKPLPNSEMERLSEEYCDALYQVGNTHSELCAEVYVACTLSNV